MADVQEPVAEQAPAAEDTSATPQASKQDINPWSVSGEVDQDGKVKAIDYGRLTTDFGTTLINDALLERFEKVTGHKPHRFMRRQIVFSHRDLTAILDRYEKVRFYRGHDMESLRLMLQQNEPFFLYTGRGPSSDSMHIGHTQVFDFVKYVTDSRLTYLGSFLFA